jgi:hypothetical protein
MTFQVAIGNLVSTNPNGVVIVSRRQASGIARVETVEVDIRDCVVRVVLCRDYGDVVPLVFFYAISFAPTFPEPSEVVLAVAVIAAVVVYSKAPGIALSD